MATNWAVRGLNPVGGEIFPPYQTGPEVHRAYCTMITGYISRDKASGLCVDAHPHAGRWLKEEYSYTSTPHLVLL
jgi:hypothetical protein